MIEWLNELQRDQRVNVKYQEIHKQVTVSLSRAIGLYESDKKLQNHKAG